jgi:hypothetical protein
MSEGGQIMYDPADIPKGCGFTAWECDPDSITPEQREQVCAWLRRHDLDPNNISDVVVLGDRIHVTEYVTDEAGNRLVDYAAQEMATWPRAVPLQFDPPFESKP